MSGWKIVDVGNVQFKVPAQWGLIKKLASGASGTAAAFEDPRERRTVIVKKVTDAWDDLVEWKRTLREVKLLRALQHENIIRLLDVLPPDHPDFHALYLVTDFMHTDLRQVISLTNPLPNEHHQYFSYQILRGLLYLHSANVVLCNLTPSGILVNRQCDLQICDFRLARESGTGVDKLYEGNRWYQAPEQLLLTSEYSSSKSVDVWSAGCILCELVGRNPVFAGSDLLAGIKKIFQVIGSPTEVDLEWLLSESPARRYIEGLPGCSRQPWARLFPEATPQVVEAIDRMLTFHPERRSTAQDVLLLEYYSDLREPDDEPIAETAFDWAFDQVDATKRLVQNYLYLECAALHPGIVARDGGLLAERGIDKLLRS